MKPIFVAITVALALAASPAAAHEWYPIECCSERDCQPIDDSDVRMTSRGWEIEGSGEVVPFGDRRERISPDGEFHLCSRAFAVPGGDDRAICLFVPGMSS